MLDPQAATTEPARADQPAARFYRHRLATRLWHWVNAVTIFIMIGTGLMILNAHPHLYWGRYGANPDHPWLNTWHWPGWVTIPSGYNLAIARRWHLWFALILGFGLLAYMLASLINRHFQQDLRVRLRELSPRHLVADALAHLNFEFHNPDDPRAYNTLQKLAYVSAVFVFIPLLIFTGLTMSPGMDAAWPWLLELFGGRQSARSLHFIAAAALVGFIIVHLVLVILAGPWEEFVSMVTGYWRVPDVDGHAAEGKAA